MIEGHHFFDPEQLAEDLLARHRIVVSDHASDLIAKAIRRAVADPDRVVCGSRGTPLEAARSAIKHAAAVKKQKMTSGIRQQRVKARAAKLADALSHGILLGLLGLARADPDLIGKLRNGDVDSVDLTWLDDFLRRTEHKLANSFLSRGAPIGALARAVETGCFVWKLGGRTGREYKFWNDELTGDLSNYLRDLLAACRWSEVTDSALHQAIVRQQQKTSDRVAQLQKRLALRTKKRQ